MAACGVVRMKIAVVLSKEAYEGFLFVLEVTALWRLRDMHRAFIGQVQQARDSAQIGRVRPARRPERVRASRDRVVGCATRRVRHARTYDRHQTLPVLLVVRGTFTGPRLGGLPPTR